MSRRTLPKITFRASQTQVPKPSKPRTCVLERGALPPSARARGLFNAPGIPQWDHGSLLKAQVITLIIFSWHQQILQNKQDASKTLTAVTNTYPILSNYLSITKHQLFHKC